MERPRFHLSIPSTDLEASRRWYVEGLGCTPGRGSSEAQILDLGGHQLVVQRQLEPEPCQSGIYPRHFGLVFDTIEAWRSQLERARAAGLRFGLEPKLRFEGQPLEHHTFFLIDPAQNWLEFKHYSHPDAILGCREHGVVGDAELR
ncbi:MAG: VOC family protein [Synechococcus sp. ELA057]